MANYLLSGIILNFKKIEKRNKINSSSFCKKMRRPPEILLITPKSKHLPPKIISLETKLYTLIESQMKLIKIFLYKGNFSFSSK